MHRWGAGGKMCLYSEREVLEDELCNAIKTFDIDRKRVLYKIVKAIEIKI